MSSSLTRRTNAVWALGLVALTACADLEPIAKGECGNGVIDEGEDCDSFGRLDMTCRPPDAEGACRFDCSEPNTCASGYACGQDSVCRAPSAMFRLKTTISDPANFIVPADFDGNGETDLLASGDFGLVLSYQGGDFEEEDTVDLTFTSGTALIAGGHLTDDEAADVAYLNYFDLGLGVVRGSEDRTFAGTVYPTLAIPTDQADIFAIDADPTLAGDEPMTVIELPTVATVVVRVSITTSAEADYYLSDPGDLPALEPGSLGPVRGGNLDPAKPCEQYVLVFRDRAFVGTPCLDDGSVNGQPALQASAPTVPVPIPLAPIDLSQCDVPLDRAFVLDVDADQDLDILLTPLAPIGARPCVLRGPLTVAEDLSLPLVAESYPFFTLDETYGGEEPSPERILEVGELNDDGVPDFVTSSSIFTSQSTPCPNNLIPHGGDGMTIFHCSTSEADFTNYPTYISAALGDVNADGVADVALAAYDEQEVFVHVGHGDGTFAVYPVEAEGWPEQVVLGDFDADGLDDVMFADKICRADGVCAQTEDTSDILTVAFGRISGGPEDPRSLGRLNSIESLAQAKFPSQYWGIDATVDVGVLARETGQLSFAVLFGNTRRELQAPFFLNVPAPNPTEGQLIAGPTRLTLGRFVQPVDGAPAPASTEDPHLDVVVAAYDASDFGVDVGAPISQPELRLWLLDSEGEAKLSSSQAWPSRDALGPWEQHEPDLAALAAGDLNGDAAEEVVYAGGVGLAIGTAIADPNDGHPFFELWQIETGLAVRSTAQIPRDFLPQRDLSPTGAVPVPLQLGDLDGDGWRDIVLLGETPDGEARILVLWNDGAGQFDTANSSTAWQPIETTAYLLLNVDEDPALEVLVAASYSSAPELGTIEAYDVVDRRLLDLYPVLDLYNQDIAVMESADFDRDGVRDLVLGHSDSMSLYRSLPRNETDD